MGNFKIRSTVGILKPVKQGFSSYQMMLRNPFLDELEDDYGDYPNYQGNYYGQRLAEDARRRAEIERFYRMKQLQEQRRRHEEMRKRRQRQLQEEEYQRAYMEALHRRQLEEKARRQRQRNYSNESSYTGEDVQPSFKVVPGPDGRFYRVNINDSRAQQQKQNININKGTAKVPISRASSGNGLAVKQPLSNLERVSQQKDSPQSSMTNVAIVDQSLPKFSKKDKKQAAKKRITVIVEDASESEIEEDELMSGWRYRRPSPGEWIEPVEEFENLRL